MSVDPLNADPDYIRFYFILVEYYISIFEHITDKTWYKSARFENIWHPLCQIYVIFTHLKLWIASARPNFKWVKIQIE